tara:strand:- start:82 stop:666 length:585 start_codon:yes stop_codon:yes gene_type:complete
MATKTKKKLSKALKNTFLNELKGKKEEERLLRVKENSKLREITVYTDKNNKNASNIIDFLISEGVNLNQIEIPENLTEWNKVASIINIQAVPTFYVNGEYLANQRDFTNAQHVLNALKYLGNPDFDNPSSMDKLHEFAKTSQYNMHTAIQNLSKQVTPIVNFITNLQKELEEEDSNNSTTSQETPTTPGGCGKK